MHICVLLHIGIDARLAQTLTLRKSRFDLVLYEVPRSCSLIHLLERADTCPDFVYIPSTQIVRWPRAAASVRLLRNNTFDGSEGMAPY